MHKLLAVNMLIFNPLFPNGDISMLDKLCSVHIILSAKGNWLVFVSVIYN